MTESEWTACTDPACMLALLQSRGATERKLRLAGCACAARLLPGLCDRRLAALADLGARAADGEDRGDEISTLLTGLSTGMGESSQAESNGRAGVAFAAAHPPGNRHYGMAYEWLASAAGWVAEPGTPVDPDDWGGPRDEAWQAAWARERGSQADILRDIFGNPFRVVSCAPEWRTDTVVALTRGIYDERAYDRLPLLMDALMDAGCDNDELLNHCRSPGVHVRGCWVVDMLLARE